MLLHECTVIVCINAECGGDQFIELLVANLNGLLNIFILFWFWCGFFLNCHIKINPIFANKLKLN